MKPLFLRTVKQLDEISHIIIISRNFFSPSSICLPGRKPVLPQDRRNREHDEIVDYALFIDRVWPSGHCCGSAIHLEKTDKTATVVLIGPLESRIQFKIDSVILGDQKHKGTTIKLQTTQFMWPTDSVPFKQKQRCILILWGDNQDESLSLSSVLPIRSKSLQSVTTTKEAKRVLAKEMIEVINHEKRSDVQRKLILQAGPIFTSDEAERTLVPFLKHKNVWLRRAALGSLAHVTLKPKYVQMVMDDIRQFLTKLRHKDTVDVEDNGRSRWSAYGSLFTHYYCLDTGWSREDDGRTSAFLPIYRHIAKNLDDSEYYRWEGIGPLCRLGTRKDVMLLWEYYHTKQPEQRKWLEHHSHRQALIMSISRILDLGLSNWMERDFLKYETKQVEKVRQALIKGGFIRI